MEKRGRRSSGRSRPTAAGAPHTYGDVPPLPSRTAPYAPLEPADWEREAMDALEPLDTVMDVDDVEDAGVYRYEENADDADGLTPQHVKRSRPAKFVAPVGAPRGGYAAPNNTGASPVRRYDGESPNPAPPRRWPLFVFVSLTVLLMFAALNIEQRREDEQHWAAPSASAINENLVVRSSMDVPASLPTQIPQSYLDEVQEAFARTKELVTPTPFVSAPPVTPTPQPTKAPLLKKDMQSDYVLQVENRLVELGYLAEDQADGKYDSRTVSAVKAFQDACYIHADGMAGKDTVEMLFRKDAVTPTPLPTRKDEPYVWATTNGTYYHSVQDCSNMRSATEIALSDAKNNGKKPCPKCDPPRE